MKRNNDDNDSETEEPPTKQRREDSMEILEDLQTNLLKEHPQLNDHVSQRLFDTQKQYFTVYMQKMMDKVPMGKDLINIVKEYGGENTFEYTFTAAKSFITSQIKVGQIKSLNAIFDMVYGLLSRYVHEKIITPTLSHVLASEQLQRAYEAYQEVAKADDDKSVLDMQSLLFCIQEFLEKHESVKVPNPFYSRMTQQMKAMSEYVITLLVSVAKPTIHPDVVIHQDRTRDEQEKERTIQDK